MPFRKNVFILGAGFCADAGAPVMWDFLQRARQLREDPASGLGDADRQAFGRVFEYIHRLRTAEAKLTLDIENIEHLFGLAEMDLEFGAETAATIRRDLIFLILRTLERSIRTERLAGTWNVAVLEAGGPHMRRITATYGEFFAALASRRWVTGDYGIPPDGLCRDAIITMNYDCFLDDALMRVGVAPAYELPDATYPDEFASSQFRIHLLKLHGSANWFRCTSNSCRARLIIWRGEPPARLEYFYGRGCPACGQPVEPVIVPPTWAKGAHRELLAPVWRRALRVLREAGRIFIIGYSMPYTDVFFRYMLGLALATNETLEEIIVVNTDAKVLEEYERLFQEHYRARRLVPTRAFATGFITDRGLREALRHGAEGLDRQKIVDSGFPVN